LIRIHGVAHVAEGLMGWNGVGGELWQVEVTGGEGKGRVGGQRTGQQCVGKKVYRRKG
jgi:hypothetical protein